MLDLKAASRFLPVKKNEKKTSRVIEDVKSFLLTFDSAITKRNGRLTVIEQIIEELSSVATKFKECHGDLVRVKGTLFILDEKVDHLKNKRRLNNGIMCGKSEAAN